MGKGERLRRERREAREQREAEERARREAEQARQARLDAYDPDDNEAGPALPCPECDALGRRWADDDERAAALEAFDAEWGLEHEGPDDRRVAVCRACGAASVVPDVF